MSEMTGSEMARMFQGQFPELFSAVWQDHQTNTCTAGGHDLWHPIVVAQYAATIAPNQRLKTLSWIAGMCHNTDRIYPKALVEPKVSGYLTLTDSVSSAEKTLIIEAVLTHSGLNKDTDNPVTVTLKDADRLSGLGIFCPIRAGQSFPEKPIFDPRCVGGISPGSTYRNPTTVLDGIKFTLEWEAMLRLPKAKDLARIICRQHREIIRFLEDEVIQQLGLSAFKLEE